MTTYHYYKATDCRGLDFYTGTIDYGAALLTGEPVLHPNPDLSAGASRYLSVSVSAADCTGFSWPCRLFLVEPVGLTRKDSTYPSKRRVRGVRVVEELPAHLALGPQGEHVVALIERAWSLTADEAQRLDAARYADAAWALIARDLIREGTPWDQAAYDLLTKPWASTIGPVHPDDAVGLR